MNLRGLLLGVAFVISVAAAIYVHWPGLRTEAERFIDTIIYPYQLAKLLSAPPDSELLMPVEGAQVRGVADTWGAARSDGRTHEGQDIFAERGTAVYSATRGYVVRVGTNSLGGNVVFVLGSGGRGYYYAHLDSYGPDAVQGREVATTSILGFVGNTGNAEGTAPHLHFGVYTPDGAINPYPLLIDRER
jgi:peptidoglycan LD-endopeptidase LytH